MQKSIILIIVFSIFASSTNGCWCNTEPLSIKALASYKYISVVKIKKLANIDLHDKSNGNYQMADVESLENFKGDMFKKIIITSVMSSCDMGVREGDVWIFFANEINGEVALYPCGHSTNFLSQSTEGSFFYWNYPRGIGTLNFLRNYYIKFPTDGIANGKWLNGNPSYTLTRKEGKLNGKLLMFDADGKKIASFTYKDSLLNGESIIWYKNGVMQSCFNFSDGVLEGKSVEYLLNGQKSSETIYKKGMFNGVRKLWDDFGNLISDAKYANGKLKDTAIFWFRIDSSIFNAKISPLALLEKVSIDSLIKWNKRRQIERVIINDTSGKLIHSLSYFRNGNLERETIYEPNSKLYISHEYHFNGITKEYQIYWIEGNGENSIDRIRYLYEESCFGDDGKRIRKRFFDKEGKNVIKAIDLENRKEIIVFQK